MLNNGNLRILFSDGSSEIFDVNMAVNTLPSLTVMQDQGSVGAAGFAFLLDQGFMIHTEFDKFHRLQRDMRLSQERSAQACLMQAQAASQYWFG